MTTTPDLLTTIAAPLMRVADRTVTVAPLMRMAVPPVMIALTLVAMVAGPRIPTTSIKVKATRSTLV
jgi:hypothetical protein